VPAPTFVIRRVGIYGKFRWLLFGTIFPPFLLLCVLLFCARMAAAIMLSLAGTRNRLGTNVLAFSEIVRRCLPNACDGAIRGEKYEVPAPGAYLAFYAPAFGSKFDKNSVFSVIYACWPEPPPPPPYP